MEHFLFVSLKEVIVHVDFVSVNITLKRHKTPTCYSNVETQMYLNSKRLYFHKLGFSVQEIIYFEEIKLYSLDNPKEQTMPLDHCLTNLAPVPVSHVK